MGDNIPELVDVLKSIVPDLLDADSHLTGREGANERIPQGNRYHLEIDCHYSETVYM